MQPSFVKFKHEPPLHDTIIRLNAVRILTALLIAFGYASTMPLGPDKAESLLQLGFQPSWVGIQVIFFFSGVLALKSLETGGGAWDYIRSKALRILPAFAFITFFVIAIIYPFMGQSDEGFLELSLRLTKYFILTVLCITPGVPLPGLLDNVTYTSLIQGAVWTFRYGLLLHIAVTFAGYFNLYKNKKFILIVTALVTLAFIFTVAAERTYIAYAAPISKLSTILRLGHAFLLGMSFWAYKDYLPTTSRIRGLILIALIVLALLAHLYSKGSAVVEIFLCGFWIYLAWLTAMSKTTHLNVLNNWPHLVLGIYIINWPISQLLAVFFPELGRWTLPLVNLPLTLLLAYILHKSGLFLRHKFSK